jgi:cell division septum initiation protein DivIVA
MDGNTSNNEEDDFLDALKDELPQVFKAIDENFKQINEFNTDLKKQSG